MRSTAPLALWLFPSSPALLRPLTLVIGCESEFSFLSQQRAAPLSSSQPPKSAKDAHTVAVRPALQGLSCWPCEGKGLSASTARALRHRRRHRPSTCLSNGEKLGAMSRTARNRWYRACLAGSCARRALATTHIPMCFAIPSDSARWKRKDHHDRVDGEGQAFGSRPLATEYTAVRNPAVSCCVKY